MQGVHHQEQADEAVGGIAAHAGDAPHRLVAEPAHPEALAVGLAVDGHIPHPWREALPPGPAGQAEDLGLLQGADGEGR
jgi:hypothetical protein